MCYLRRAPRAPAGPQVPRQSESDQDQEQSHGEAEPQSLVGASGHGGWNSLLLNKHLLMLQS